ncbi:Smoothened [Fasciola gigantica]|uniref:Smoothened n=1 Tax=Fasciola gigantica TaxID=46835 RepID=A0A504YFG5_FASGI|nr:Smoothened [Fasciola gigantica]
MVSSLARSNSSTHLNHLILVSSISLPKPVESGGPKSDGPASGLGIPSYHDILPEAEICEAVHKACPLLVPFSCAGPAQGEEVPHVDPVQRPVPPNPLPRFFHRSLYTPGFCQYKLTARLFQSSGGGCKVPLITTSVLRKWSKGIERFSFPCQRPLFDAEHYSPARRFTATATLICLVMNVTAWATLRLQNRERKFCLEHLVSGSHPTEFVPDLLRVQVVLSAESPVCTTHPCHTKVVFGGLSAVGRLIPHTPSPAQIHRPMVKPIRLQLLTYFVLNAIFASMCSFDASVKHSWRFSWLDPRVFRTPLFHNDLCMALSSSKDTSSPSKLVHLKEMLSSSDVQSRSLGPGERLLTSDVLPTGLCKTRTNDNDCGARDGNGHSPPEPGLFTETWPHPGLTLFDDLVPHVVRVIALYEHSALDHRTILFFRHFYHQLALSTGNPSAPVTEITANAASTAPTATTTTTTSSSRSSNDPLDRPATASDIERRFMAGSGANLVASNQPAQTNLVRSMTALYEQCQKHLTAASSSSTRQGGRDRSLLPNQTSTRRENHSRSLSAGGIEGAVSTGAASTVSATSAVHPNESLPKLLSAAASLLAAAATGSLIHGITDRRSLRLGSTSSDRDRRSRLRRFNQSVISSFLSSHPFHQCSGVASPFDGSQLSSSSVRSALIKVPGNVLHPAGFIAQGNLNAASSQKLSSTRRIGRNEMGTLGSQISLRSLSCGSSSGAESYNSYRLVVSRAGAIWSELWRMRMLLMDVMRWAEAVAPLAQANNVSITPEAHRSEQSGNYPVCLPPVSAETADPVD